MTLTHEVHMIHRVMVVHDYSRSVHVAVRRTLDGEDLVMGSMNRHGLEDSAGLDFEASEASEENKANEENKVNEENEVNGESFDTLHAAGRSLDHGHSQDRRGPGGMPHGVDEDGDDAHQVGAEDPAAAHRSSSPSRS
jgi:hypothetical protein